MALSNDEKSKILTNDEKALDQSYKSPINFMGRKCYLGRTNEITLKEINFIMADFNKLEKIESIEEFKKLKTGIITSLKDVIGNIVDGLEEEDFEFIGILDLQDIVSKIGAREMKRMGLSDEKITEALEKDKKRMKKAIEAKINEVDESGDEEPDFREEKTQNKE